MFSQLVTIEVDNLDSYSNYSKVLNTPAPLTKNDHVSLNYAFGINLPDDSITVEIQPLEEAIELIDPSMDITVLLAEKHNGKIMVNSHTMPLSEFNTSTFSTLVKTDAEIKMAYAIEIFSLDPEVDSYVFGFNATALKPSNDECSYSKSIPLDFIKKHQINTNLSFGRINNLKDGDNYIRTTGIIFPEQKLFIEKTEETKRKADAPPASDDKPFDFDCYEEHHTVNLYSFDGDLIDTIHYVKSVI